MSERLVNWVNSHGKDGRSLIVIVVVGGMKNQQFIYLLFINKSKVNK